MKVCAVSFKTDNQNLATEDNISITVSFSDGTIGSVLYLGNRDKSLPKELIELFSGQKVGGIHDFIKGVLQKGNK